MKNDNIIKSIESFTQKRIMSFFSLGTTILIMIFIAIVIKLLVKDVLDFPYILSNFSLSFPIFTPEKSEKIQFLSLVVLFPFIYATSYYYIKKYCHNFSTAQLKRIIVFEILGSSYLAIFLYIMDITKYFSYITHSKFILLGAIILFPVMFILYEHTNKIIKSLIHILLLLAVGMFLFLTFYLYHTQTYAMDHSTLHHFDAYYFPIYKVLSGQTIGKDFTNLYGFYPYIYELFLNIKTVTIEKISIINATLMVLSAVFISTTFFLNIKNKILAFIGFCAYLYYFHLFMFLKNTTYLLQFNPHRIFFITMIMALISIYLQLKNKTIKKIIKYAGFLIAAIALFWNFESGIVALGGWSALFIFLDFNKPDRNLRLLGIIALAFTSVALAIGSICLITYLRTGMLIGPIEMFNGQYIFYANGFGMIKMTLFDQPWLIFALIYLIAIGSSIQNLFEQNIKQETRKKFALYFTFGIIGLGAMLYYQGRSHINTLGASIYPSLVLLVMFSQDYYLKYVEFKNYYSLLQNTDGEKCYKSLSQFIYFTFILKFTIIAAVFVLATASGIYIYSYYPQFLQIAKQELFANHQLYKNFAFLSSHAGPFDILTEDAATYYTLLKQPDFLPFPGITDWFRLSDYDNIINYLSKSNNKLVIDQVATKLIVENKGNKFYKLLNSQYELEADNSYIKIFKKTKKHGKLKQKGS